MNTHQALPPEVSIYTAAEVKAHLLDCARTEQAEQPMLTLDASAVRDIDGAGVQLLLALDNSLRRQGRRLVLHSAGQGVREALMRLGADGLLNNAEPMEASA